MLSLVKNRNGEYLIITHTDSCECADAEYNLGDGEPCKHVRRAQIATGETPMPDNALGVIERDSIFEAQLDTSAEFATADGGLIDGETGEEIYLE
jgi:uncharacterized protein YuzB (UPF0349 family)